MSKRSVATSREAPVPTVSSVASGGLVIHSESFTIDTNQRVEIVDLTDRIMTHVRSFAVREGRCRSGRCTPRARSSSTSRRRRCWPTSRSFSIDFAPTDRRYLHNDPDHSDCSRSNADSHLRAMLLGHSLTLQISGGEVVLGRWQRILMAELDGARSRTLRVQIMGVT